MSKERLEEIKEAYEKSHKHIGAYLNSEGIEWLIAQAERVQELEEENKELKGYIDQHIRFMNEEYSGQEDSWNLERLKRENERYRETFNKLLGLLYEYSIWEEVHYDVEEILEELEKSE